MKIKEITPCLWFDSEAEEAARFYISIFPDSGIDHIAYFGKEGFEHHGKKEGTVLTVNFRLNGQPFVALNGGPVFRFSEAISFQVFCDTQEEIDYYWDTLTDGGMESQCGWLKDKYGLSWQIVPSELSELMSDPAASERVTAAFLPMKKLEIDVLRKAAAGG